ncbi:unnamed protein product [Pedinophyceae sp. YPF-701]|nr:unnamed protein product [Pedinophyceae sp. YPF-701]
MKSVSCPVSFRGLGTRACFAPGRARCLKPSSLTTRGAATEIATCDGFADTVAALESIGVDFGEDDPAEVLGKGYGWGGQGYWRGAVVNAEPSPEFVRARTDRLVELGLSTEDVAALVKKFPQVLALDNASFEEAIQKLQNDFFLRTTPALVGVLRRRPDVLGMNIDCEGDCAGECNRCWVRF